ncbi:MAG: hypothetical protein K6G62_08045 [Eubacterium sp.]|nr:hypothetical protein [Eubacterium sp.]
MEDKKKIFSKISGCVFGLFGLITLFIAFMVSKMAVQSTEDLETATIGADEQGLISWIVTGAIIYGILCLLYAYLRFAREKKNVLTQIFYKHRFIVVLFVILTIITLFVGFLIYTSALTYLLAVGIPFTVLALTAIAMDAYLYVNEVKDFVRKLPPAQKPREPLAQNEKIEEEE